MAQEQFDIAEETPPYSPAPEAPAASIASGQFTVQRALKTTPKWPLATVAVLGACAAVAATSYEPTKLDSSYAPTVTAIDGICDQAHPGVWTLVSGMEVLPVAKEVKMELFHEAAGRRDLLASASRLSASCLEGSAPLLVVGFNPVGNNVVELTGTDGSGQILGSGVYHFKVNPEVLEEYAHLSKKSSLATPDASATWAYVESEGDEVGCLVLKGSRVNTLCGIDLQSTGRIETR